MKKFDWGTGIALVIAAFLTAMMLLLWIAMRHPSDLVADNYYERELAYQERIVSARRAEGVPDAVRFTRSADTLSVRFSPRAASPGMNGTVRFYRPSDRRMDFAVAMRLDAACMQRIVIAGMARGLWKVQIDWSTGERDYFSEQPLVID